MTAPAPLWPLSPVNLIPSVCPTFVGQIFLLNWALSYRNGLHPLALPLGELDAPLGAD